MPVRRQPKLELFANAYLSLCDPRPVLRIKGRIGLSRRDSKFGEEYSVPAWSDHPLLFRTYLGEADTFDTLQVYWTRRSSTPGRGRGPMREPFGDPGELGGEASSRDELTLGLPRPSCFTKLHVPQGSPGPRAASVCTLNFRVVRGENSETTMA